MAGDTSKKPELDKKEVSPTKILARCRQCGRLLGIFEVAKGEIKCERCHSIQKVDI